MQNCGYQHCPRLRNRENVDWGHYLNVSGGCIHCQVKCYQDPRCSSVECNSTTCIWWNLGKCAKEEEKSDFNKNRKTCRKLSKT